MLIPCVVLTGNSEETVYIYAEKSPGHTCCQLYKSAEPQLTPSKRNCDVQDTTMILDEAHIFEMEEHS